MKTDRMYSVRRKLCTLRDFRSERNFFICFHFAFVQLHFHRFPSFTIVPIWEPKIVRLRCNFQKIELLHPQKWELFLYLGIGIFNVPENDDYLITRTVIVTIMEIESATVTKIENVAIMRMEIT